MERKAFPKALVRATHYHNRRGYQPNPNAIPPGFEMVELVTGGRGWVEHEGDWLEGTAGCLFWHASGDKTIGRSDPDDPYHCLAVLFETPGLNGRSFPRLTHWPEQDEVRIFTRDVVRRFIDDAFDRDALCAYVYGCLLYQLTRWRLRFRSPAVPNELLTMLSQIDRHFDQSLTIEDFAQETGWSTPHLHARCREYLDSSPHQLLMARRLRAAKEMLASSDMPIKQVAAKSGYGGESSFSRQFKRATGMTPKEYQRQHAYPLIRD